MRNLTYIIAALSIYLSISGCAPGGEAGGSSPLAFLPFVLIFVVFYFLILRPQQKQGKERKRMLSELKRGDDIVTSGGIYGKITNVAEDDLITLEIAKGVSIKITRSGIAGLQPSAEEPKGGKN
ncbi:MAG: preprotein translocase subunit YajC [Thermodesulfobacteriota bacterium]|nr:MAG: preprotein translocase subunit YajC [Thermodesulfobacteriota bacterium]